MTNTANITDKKIGLKRLWRSVVTVLASIVVFVTTYALIIPAITWERTLICELEEHVHTEKCYNAAGELKCTKQEHTHNEACFDAPEAAEKMYVCGKAEHTHSEDCYFPDGTLKCTLPEHQHTLECKNNVRTVISKQASDGAVAVICGALPENAQAEITAVPLSAEEMVVYFGAEKSAQMTGYVAYDIRITVDGEEWQPNETVSVTVRHPELEMSGGSQLNLAHVEDGTDSVTDIEVRKNTDGDMVFDADGFSLYIFYTSFTVDFYYEDSVYSINGLDSVLLGDLFGELGIERNAADAVFVTFTDGTLVSVRKNAAGEWVLLSLKAFDTLEKLTVTFGDGTELVIPTTDQQTGRTLPTGMTITWNDSTRQAKLTYVGKSAGSGEKALQYKLTPGTPGSWQRIASATGTDYTVSWVITKNNNSLLPARVCGLRVITSAGDMHGTLVVEKEFNIIDDSNEYGAAALLDYIEADVSNFGYGSGNDVFTSWLENCYLNNRIYGSPDHLPETQKELSDAYHYFFTGKDKDGDWADDDIFNPNITDGNESADEITPSDYSDAVDYSVSMKIDWFGDNGKVGMDDFYRLYCGFETEVRPVDLLLVIDQSASMQKTVSGGTANDKDDNPSNDSRQSILLKALDGEPLTRGADGLPSSRAGGFIQSFLGTAQNPTGNNLAILTFGSDSSAGGTRYIRTWNSTSRFSGLTEDAATLKGDTNYAAALSAADVIWKDTGILNSGNLKIMIFISDGEPTLAYSDGGMNTGFSDDKNGVFTVGTGGDAGSLSVAFPLFLDAVKKDADKVAAGSAPSYNQNRVNMGVKSDYKDDSGLSHLNFNFWVNSSTKKQTSSFPKMADIRDMEITIPGLSSLMGGFVDENGNPDADASTFRTWYGSLDAAEKENWVYGGIVNGVWNDSNVESMTVYDIFELSKSAFYEFQSSNSGVMTYTIGFGDSVTGTCADGVTGKDDVLKYMAGEQGVDTENCTYYLRCGDTKALTDALRAVAQMSGVVMTDVLSDYVTPAFDTSVLDFDISYSLGDEDPVELMNGGSLTAEGEAVLDMSSGATGFTTVGNKTYLKVVFKDSVIFTEDVKVEAAFTVRTTEAAKVAYRNNNKQYTVTGDIDSEGTTPEEIYITDYDLSEGHITSSNCGGLYTSDESFGDEVTGVTWKYMGEQNRAFPKPVVQIAPVQSFVDEPTMPPENPAYSPDNPVEVTIKKQIDYLGDNGTEGMEDLYRLYLSLQTEIIDPMDLLLVIDQSGSMARDMDGNERYLDHFTVRVDVNDFEYDEDYGYPVYRDEDTGHLFVYDEDDGVVYYWDEVFDELMDDTEYDPETGEVNYWPTIPLYFNASSEDFSEEPGDEYPTYRDETTGYLLAYDEDEDWVYYFDEYLNDWYEVDEYDPDTGDGCIYSYDYPNPAFSGTSRQDILIEFINGKESDYSDGFISFFRNANPDNRLAVLTFSDDSSEDRYIMDWDDTDSFIDLPDDPEGATNYSAALDVANGILEEAREEYPNKRRVMIFLSDGAPTIAYADGKLHRGFDEETDGTFGVGSGNSFARNSLVGLLDRYIYCINNPDFPRDLSGYEIEGDDGYTYRRGEQYIELFSLVKDGEGYDLIWPLMYDFNNIELNVPGTEFPEFRVTDQDQYDLFEDMWRGFTDDEKLEWITDHLEYSGDAYDVFYLTESAFEEFSKDNTDVPVFTLFFTGSDDKTLPSGRPANEVLRYMAGDDHPDAPKGRYHHFQSCSTPESLANAIISVIGLSGVHITDPLSEYVDVAEVPNLEIKFTNAAYSTYDGYPYLYRNNAFTALGNMLLDTDATKLDAANKTLNVVFRPESIYTGIFECEASFDVRVNEMAIETYITNGNNYGGVEGDPGTDYPGNSTSSEKPGFYSNDGADAEWNYYGNHDKPYDDPVVQLRPAEIELEKINAINSPLSGAEFDLYREFTELTDDCIVYIDTNGVSHYLYKINAEAFVSDSDSPIAVDNLQVGTYYLFETKAPDGYNRLTGPILFELDSKAIKTIDTNAVWTADSPLLLRIINTGSHELPPTGGNGIRTLYIIGAFLMLGALTIGHILWRRREGRGEM